MGSPLSTALQEAAASQNVQRLQQLIASVHPADSAEFLGQIEVREALALLENLPMPQRASVYGHLSLRRQRAIAELMHQRQLELLLTQMDPDERADLFNALDPKLQEKVLENLGQSEQHDLRLLSAYKEGTAGAIMTSALAAIPTNLSAGQALEALRSAPPAAEAIYEIYVVDEARRIQGKVPLRDLILSDPQTAVRELMLLDVVSAVVDMPQEQAARLIARYDLPTLPVLDADERLVGVVTYDDAMDVVEAEATEDILKGATVGKLERGVSDSSLFTLYRKRIGWLVLLVFANIFSGAGISYFEDTIAAHVALVFFLPLLIDSGGNAGSQAATLMVRGLATGDVNFTDWWKMLRRELLVALGLGVTMAIAVSGLGIIRGGPGVAIAVSLSMVVIVLIGSVIGTCLPFILRKTGMDPATASAPLVTSMADACGVLIYFSIATAVLGTAVASG